jgi:hypothetical protein
MANKVKSKKSKKVAKENKGQDLLLPPPDGKFKQDKVDGSGVLKETVSKEIQAAADYFFAKKAEESTLKATLKSAVDKLIQAMDFEEKTSVVVYNSEERRKDRINLMHGEEKLKVEKNITVE